MPLIFQYGSNCSTERLNSPKRLDGAAEPRGRAQTVSEYEIAFDVWSDGNRCATADLIPAHKPASTLGESCTKHQSRAQSNYRKVEGPHYEKKAIHIRNRAGEEMEATTFFVKCTERQEGLWTSAEYVRYIVRGLRDREIPE